MRVYLCPNPDLIHLTDVTLLLSHKVLVTMVLALLLLVVRLLSPAAVLGVLLYFARNPRSLMHRIIYKRIRPMTRRHDGRSVARIATATGRMLMIEERNESLRGENVSRDLRNRVSQLHLNRLIYSIAF